MLIAISNHRRKIAYAFLLLFYTSLFEPLIAMGRNVPHSIRYHRGKRSSAVDRPLGNMDTGEKPVDKKRKKPAVPPIDIDGPGQPEMKSFQSVNAGNMVDLFSGDFSYAIPLLDVEGYGVNLHYSSGITMDQEASWVGLGWNINPGTISRSLRGLPDDFDGKNDSITKTQSIRENKTVGVTVEPSLEIVGNQYSSLNLSARLGVFHNNYNGYGLETGVGIGGTGKSTFGSLTTNLSISNNSQEGIRVSPSLSVAFGNALAKDRSLPSLGISTGYSSRTGISSLQIDGGIKSTSEIQKIANYSMGVNYPLATISFANRSYTPSINMPIRNSAFSFTGKVGGEVWGTDGSVSFTGYGNSQDIADRDTTQTAPAAGYIYSINTANREDVIQDFNREKEVEFNYKTTPHIAIPQYTYDAFSISGEGTGGSFRPYRGDVGYIFDHSIKTRSYSENGSIDVGIGEAVHVGLEITNITTNTGNHRWSQNNNIESKLRFQSSDTTFESVYFRNPGEKITNALSYYRAIGDDSLIRIKLAGSKDNVHAESTLIKYNDEGKADAELPVSEALVKKQRDKRTQVISYLTAEDAAVLGLDKKIRSYTENVVPVGLCSSAYDEIERVDGTIRKKNHISEISVLNSDGRKYIYGVPANNLVQKDVTFAVDNTNPAPDTARGLAGYTPNVDNTTKNRRGKDNYFSKEEMPSYTHNFLLSGIVSPDYTDLTGNGISEDDPGDAIKFNYSQVYGANTEVGYYKWRTPFQKDTANYNEGFKTYNRDDKATYLYGEKEIWYLNSIESKTMIAVFHLVNDRQDTYAVNGENGGLNTSKATRRLDRIDLYVKADIIKKGLAKARPVKTVHFSYNYELCKGAQGNSSVGKLTLKKVWFTYNKNNKGQLNPYTFSYHPDASGNPIASYNPSFNSGNSDRWGTYKHRASNPGNMTNADFPYTTQNKDTANRNASVWSLTDISLPSGGKIYVSYEADDYAYVQNRRATQMTTIAGINIASGEHIYNPSGDHEDYYTIYVNTPEPLKNKADLRNKYLAVDDIVYFKIAVSMPADKFGSGVEMVPGYGTIADYGITPGNNQQFWIRLAPVEGRSPLTRAAIQFLRLNLKSKAFPNSEGVDDLGVAALIKMMATSFTEIRNMVKGFDDATKSRGLCNNVDLSKSFVRLSSPDYKKYGGGYRVKRVEVYDSWKKMTNQRESVYGQDYIYTTTEDVDGVKKTISSGVATWEPGIGGEENPFRRPISYTEKVAPMAPVAYMYSEEPLGESFFPSPSVGYSKVRVRTIHTKARSANGWEETEYYTSRDFPVIVSHTLLEDGVSKFKYETMSNILRLNHKNYITLSQGFRIELNDMNGKMKAQSTYAETDSINPIKYALNFYKVDDDRSTLKHLNNEVWVVDSVNGNVNTHGQIGKDIEMMTDLREQRSLALTRGFSPNVDVIAPFIPPPVPVLYLPSKVNLPQKEDVRYRSAAVVKIVQRYGILDSVVVMDKGSVVSTKNLVYDGETGNVVLSRTNNEFNDPIYNFNYPAYWAYSGMGPAYKNIGAVFERKKGTDGFALNKGLLYKEGSQERFPVDRFFESGDEVYVYAATLYSAGPDCRYLGTQGAAWKGRLWVINAAKGKENDKGLYFIDSLGRRPPLMMIQRMVIVRSGKRNMQDVSAGNVVMLNSPLKELGGGRVKIVIDSTTRVVNASAATFKDMWKVENGEYEQDSCYTVVRDTTRVFYPSFDHFGPSAVFREVVYVVRRSVRNRFPVGNVWTGNYATSSRKVHVNGNKHFRYSLKSVMKYDLNTVLKPTDSITNAVLNLNAGAPTTVWQDIDNDDVNYFRQKVKAHYMNGELYQRTNASNIKQVIAQWNINTTGFNSLMTGNTSVAVAEAGDTSCANRPSDVTTMVRDMVKNPSRNNGFALSLNDISGGIDNDQSSERTLSFCANWNEGPTSINCVNCNMSTLTVSYITSKDTCVKLCRKNISDTATNPYRWGILGNWRMERSYVYYYDREETNAAEKATNIRTEGTLKNFIPYWSFDSTGITASTDTSRWVWNSAISAFNRKGFEIENFDALGRYNAGLYGYNQTLPVAVAQNSRYRELLYDGFEDYGYKTTYCDSCLPKREFDFRKGNTGVDTTTAQSHTGLYSIKINSGSESLLTVPVESDTLAKVQRLSVNMDTSEIFTTKVVGAGTGLRGEYHMGKGNAVFCNINGGPVTVITPDPVINFNWGLNTAPPVPLGPGACDNRYWVSWTGTIQPRYTDRYRFHFTYNGTASISVNGINLHTTTQLFNGEATTNFIDLEAGKLYPISITYSKMSIIPAGNIQLRWSSLVNQTREIIPSDFLYPVIPAAADTTGSILYNFSHYCYEADTVKPENVIRQTFSPLNHSNLTVSAWVRLDVADCNATPALDSAIQVNFNTGGTPATVWLKKTGLRIEGWQRYEANVSVPGDADSMYVRLKTLADQAIYVDDIRIQPFNSSMKSYVYNPVNLRLMAQLDENNYASFYEYDDDGTLIRVKKEAERGIMTVQETRSALLKE